MAIETLEPHLITSLQQSAREIFETMVSMPPTSIDAAEETESSFDDEVIGLLGFTGTRSGTFVVRTDEALARAIASRMLMVDPADMADFADTRDAFGEVVNMVAGNFKNVWVAGGSCMDLSVPNVIHRGVVSVQSAADGCLRSRVRVTLAAGRLDIGVHFEAKD
jgi:chemotaxis protein CheX